MKIKQVEELVGVTSKNIRFYEQQGLICPNRAENGYREYGLKEVHILKQIKLLRKLGIPIKEIKSVFDGEETLAECMDKAIDSIQMQQKNLGHMEFLANKLMERKETISSLDTDAWLDEMEKMEKEGARFMDVDKMDIHRKKKAGAIIGGIVMIAFLVVMTGITVWTKHSDPDMPMALAVILVVVFVAIIIAIIVALKSRLEEIDGGEEDEALKY